MKVAAIQMPTVKDKMQNIRTAGTYTVSYTHLTLPTIA